MDIQNKLFIDAIEVATVPLGKFLKTKYGHVQVDFDTCFGKYLKRSHSYFSVTKTLISKHEPVNLKSIHVELDYELAGNVIAGKDILSKIISLKNTIVFGTAGSGKSVLAKILFLDTILERTGFIPILIELRNLKSAEIDNQNIEQYIFNQIHALNPSFTLDQLKYALSIGKFLLIMDGYDEVQSSSREHVARNIQSISYGNPNSIIVVTSRYDEQIESWNEFHTIFTKAMTVKQAVQVVKKVGFNEVVKQKFVERLEDDLFITRSEFLSNPLLLTIMLLTFDELADIPSKMHIYYEHAFNTLYYKHDANKGVYKRQHYSALAIDEFKKVFSAFCLQTYLKSMYRFTRSQVIEFLQTSLKLEKPSEGFSNAEDLLKDLTESVCLLQQDGFEFTFVHRSFQEYFAADYISRSNSLDIRQLLDHIICRSDRDDLLDLLYEIDTELVESQWILPRINDLTKDLSEYLANDDFRKFIYKFITNIGSTSERFNSNSVLVGLGVDYYFYAHLNRYNEMLKSNIFNFENGFARKFSSDFFENHCIPNPDNLHGTPIAFVVQDFSILDIENESFSNMYPAGFFEDVIAGLYELQVILSKTYSNKVETLNMLLESID